MNATLVPAEAALFKAAERVKTDRVLEFYAAAFTPDAPDSYGDVIAPTAFDSWLPTFYSRGQALRISFNHAAVLDSLDPTNVVGYAPAAATNVWVDDYGLRVKAFLDVTTEKGRAVEYQVESGLLKGASLAYTYGEGDRVKQGDHFLLKRITDVAEAGLVPNPANQAAVLLWMKSAGVLEEDPDLPYMTVDEFREVLLKWDGAAAMRACSSAADFRKVAFERANDSDPDTASHWALPHHPGPDGAPGNADAQGVGAALAALSGGRGGPPGLKDAAAARSHLEAHSAANKAEEGHADLGAEIDSTVEAWKHAGAASHIQRAHDALVRSGAKCSPAEVDATASAEEGDEFVTKLRLLEASLP